METTKDNKIRKHACLLIGAVVFLYCAARAYLVPITHDEAYTYVNYVRETLWDTLAYNHSAEPNNHSFNSAAAMFFSAIFGASPFVLRLHSLIACLVFLYYGYRLVNIIPNTFVAISSYIMLCSNPYMLEFFGLCRGYAAGFACIMGSLYFLYKYYNQAGISARLQLKMMLFAGLAPCFHLSFLNYFLPYCAVAVCVTIYKAFSGENAGGGVLNNLLKAIKRSYPAIIVATLALLYTISIALVFKGQNQFDFAGATGFWHDTVGSLCGSTFIKNHIPDRITCLLIVGASTFIVFFIACFYWVYNKKIEFQFFIFLLLVFSSLSAWLQFHLLGINYPIDRIALFFELLFYLCFIYAFDYASRYNKIFIVPFFLVVAYCAGTTVYAGNFSNATNWFFDAYTPAMLNSLEKLEKAHFTKEKPLKLGIDWIFEPAINYYRNHDKMYWLTNVTRNGLDASQDYYFVFKDNYTIDTTTVKIIKKYPYNILLIKNLHPYLGDTIAFGNQNFETAGNPILRFKGNAHSGGYYEKIGENESTDRLTLKYPATGTGDSLMVYVSAWVKYGHLYNKGCIILSADKWTSVRTSDGMAQTNDWEKISFETGVPATKEQDKKIEIWVNNYGRGSFYVDDVQALITKIPKNGSIMPLHKK